MLTGEFQENLSIAWALSLRCLKPLKPRQTCVYIFSVWVCVYVQIHYKLSGWEGVHSFFQLLTGGSVTLPKVKTGIPGWLIGLAPAFGPGRDPGVLGSSPTSDSWHGACFSLCLYLCLSLSMSIKSQKKKKMKLWYLLWRRIASNVIGSKGRAGKKESVRVWACVGVHAHTLGN